jgi:Flp pilus assembly protein TadD
MQTVTNVQETQVHSSGHDQAALLFERAIQSLELGQQDKAMDELRQIVSLAPNLSAPHNNLGILYKRKGLLDKAIEEYKQAIRIKPDYAEAHNNLGIAYREKGLFKEAEMAYREALRLKSDLVETHYNLGVLYELYLNRSAEAIQHYKDYLRLGGPKTQEVELWISVLQQKLQAPQLSP